MSKTDNGGPAFPVADLAWLEPKAMQGLIASLVEGEDFTERGAEWAYKVADAMLKARGEEK